MRLMTIFSLATRSESELRVLFRQVSEVLVRSDLGSADRRNALASRENIAIAIRSMDSGESWEICPRSCGT